MSGQLGSKKLLTMRPSSITAKTAPRASIVGHPLFHATRSSWASTAPVPYNAHITTKPKGVKNSAGGDELVRSSAMTGARKNSTSAGATGFFSLMRLSYTLR